MDDKMIDAAKLYAAQGWRVVLNHGIDELGKCSCGRPDCGTPGKHPRYANWAEKATSDEDTIDAWRDQYQHGNIGLLLGPGSGIIDIETDSEEGAALARELLGEDGITPTYRSSRGKHRLFRFSGELPQIQKFVHAGLEIRIGGGNSSTQSIAPPSKHHSGIEYQWENGLSLMEADLAPVPTKILELIAQGPSRDGGFGEKKAARKILDSAVRKGDRHDHMMKFAVRCSMRMSRVCDEEESDLLQILKAVNVSQCNPPLPNEEVESIFRYAVQYRLKAETEEVESHGFSATRVGTETQISAGEIKLTIYKSDPIEYRLYVPAWKSCTPNNSGVVTLTPEQYDSAKLMQLAVLAQTGEVCLDRYPGYWQQIWGGIAATEKRKAVVGLKKILVDDAIAAGRIVIPPPADSRISELAGWLLERLDTALPATDEDRPHAQGRPQWRQDGTLWFAWTRVCEEIGRAHKPLAGEMKALRRAIVSRMGGDWRQLQARMPDGSKKYYSVFSRADIEAVRAIENAGLSESVSIDPIKLPTVAARPNLFVDDSESLESPSSPEPQDEWGTPF